jgi:hypothetical protein
MRTMLIWLMLCGTCFAQYNTQADVKPIEATIVMADSVVTYPVDGRVAVILEKPDAKPSLGLMLAVKSDAKWVTVSAGKSFTDLKPLPQIEPGKYLLVGQSGKYLTMILESSPDGPPAFQFLELTLGEIKPEPDPTPEDPPVGDFSSVTEMVKQSVLAMNEPRVAQPLLAVYSGLAAAPTLTFGDASKARQNALLKIRGVQKPWNIEFAKWEAEIQRIGVGDLTKYREAIKAISLGLQDAGVTTSTAIKYRQVCVGGVCYWVAE